MTRQQERMHAVYTGSEPRLHTPESVAERLGVGRTKVFALIKSGELRSIKLGKHRRVSETALAEFINRMDAAAETAGAA